MTFSDIFKKSFLEGYTNIGGRAIIVAFAFSCLFAIYIYLTYRMVTKKKLYSKSFNMSLAGVCVITTSIILTIQTSIVVSLGMVGALSIVRFRTAIKDPIDLMFLFWAISTGIICGAGVVEIAIISSIIITLGLFILNYIPVIQTPMLLSVNSENTGAEKEITDCISGFCNHYCVKSRNLTANYLELVIELRTSRGSELSQSIMKINGVKNVSLITHEGEAVL